MPAKRSRVPETPRKPRAPRVPHWVKEGERLAAVLAARSIGQTEFAESIGRKFHTVHRWCKGFEFGPENQAIAALALDLPTDAFESDLKRRERQTRAVLARFKERSSVAASLGEADWLVLRSIRFQDASLRPSVAFYEAVAWALKGAIRVDEIMTVAEENAALDEALAHKPPLRRR